MSGELDKRNMYSVWLMPEPDISKKIYEIIEGLAIKYGSTPFEPHVTLLGQISAVQEDALKMAESLAASSTAMNIEFGKIGNSDAFFKSIFVRIKYTEMLQRFYKNATSTFKMEPGKFMPHMSLVYFNVDKQTRLDAVRHVDGAVFRDLNGFYVDRLYVYSTYGAVSGWKRAGEFSLGR